MLSADTLGIALALVPYKTLENGSEMKLSSPHLQHDCNQNANVQDRFFEKKKKCEGIKISISLAISYEILARKKLRHEKKKSTNLILQSSHP